MSLRAFLAVVLAAVLTQCAGLPAVACPDAPALVCPAPVVR